MLDFEQELKKFQPISETADVEDLILRKDLTDMTDLMKEILADKGSRQEN